MATKLKVLPQAQAKKHLLANPYFLGSLAVDFMGGYLASMGLQAGMSAEWLFLVTVVYNVTGVLFLVAYLQNAPGIDEAYRKFGVAAALIATLTGLAFGQVPDHPILFSIGLTLGLYALANRPREAVDGIASWKMLLAATVAGYVLGGITNNSTVWALTFAVADIIPAIVVMAVAQKYPRFLYPVLATAFLPAAFAFTMAITSAGNLPVPSATGSILSVLLASAVAVGFKKSIDWASILIILSGFAGIILIIVGFGIK
ncbi:MAG: hypothetical protein AAB443_02555 [Patescibacteria group bacterium]